MIHDDTGSVEGGTGWYLVVLSQCNLVLLGINWNWVSTTLLCLYILKKVEFWSDVTIAGRTYNGQTNKERYSYSANGPWTAEMSKYFIAHLLPIRPLLYCVVFLGDDNMNSSFANLLMTIIV